MKCKIYAVLVLCLLLPLNSCLGQYISPGTNDYSYAISGGYAVWRNGANDNTAELTLDKRSTLAPSSIVISNRLTGIAWDQSYILASQIETPSFSPVSSGESVQTNYYIIQLQPQNKMYEPLTEEEFEQKRTELGVSTALVLQDPNKFRYLSSDS